MLVRVIYIAPVLMAASRNQYVPTLFQLVKGQLDSSTFYEENFITDNNITIMTKLRDVDVHSIYNDLHRTLHRTLLKLHHVIINEIFLHRG